MRTFRWAFLPLIVLLSACSLGRGGTSTPQGVQGDSLGVGPGISIEQALASNSDEPLLINGLLLVSPQGEVQFCTALGESRPPTCSGPSIFVVGLAVEDAGELAEAQGVKWSEAPIQLLGSIENGRLVVSARSI